MSAVELVADPSGLLHPVQRHVQQHGADHPALGSSLLGRGEPSLFDHPCLQPLLDLIPGGKGAEMGEQQVVIYSVECRRQIRVEHPPAGGVGTPRHVKDGLNGVVAAPAGPKPIGSRLEPGLPLGFQRADHLRLAHAVDDHGNTERTLFSVRLRDVHALDGLSGDGVSAAHSVGQRGLPGALTTILPSTPAVLRPALSSVTRRTLMSALARDRSISFCKLWTFLRSPACAAVKMRCRRRRTSLSTRGQLIDPHSRASPSGPFTSAAMPLWRPTYPLVPGLRSPLSSQAHLTRVSTLSGPGNRPYPASCARRPAEGRSRASVSCCLSATGIGFPGHPTLAGRLGLPCGRLTGHVPVPGSHRGSHVPHERDATGVGASCISGAAVLIQPTKIPGRRLPLLNGQPLYPARTHRRGSHITRHQRRFTRFTRPVCPLPVTLGWYRGPSAFPQSFAPRRCQRRTPRVGPGHRTHA